MDLCKQFDLGALLEERAFSLQNSHMRKVAENCTAKTYLFTQFMEVKTFSVTFSVEEKFLKTTLYGSVQTEFY
jgi:hypothetical protein